MTAAAAEEEEEEEDAKKGQEEGEGRETGRTHISTRIPPDSISMTLSTIIVHATVSVLQPKRNQTKKGGEEKEERERKTECKDVSSELGIPLSFRILRQFCLTC